ncbi:MAG: polysaccharide deacetylase family protein [Cyanobacteria bacterium]|nr:polysaccharide deacetylase family protein [Cyanobacteriota bacterium]
MKSKILNKKYIMFGFDMETDVGSTSVNYEGVKHGTYRIVDVLEKYSVKSTFLWTGDCALKNENILRFLDSKGYEIGCHSLFHEDLGDVNFISSSISRILDEELEHRLKLNVDIVKNVTKKDPKSFRSPRGFGSNKLIEILEKLGFEQDSSYLQFNRGDKNFPYFASRINWEEPGDSNILELPCFSFDMENAADNTFAKRLDSWPRLRTHGAGFVFENMQEIINNQIKKFGMSALTFYLHPWEFYEMPKSIKYAEGTLYYDEFLYKNTGEVQVKEFDDFIKLALENGIEIVDFSEFRKIYLENFGK